MSADFTYASAVQSGNLNRTQPSRIIVAIRLTASPIF